MHFSILSHLREYLKRINFKIWPWFELDRQLNTLISTIDQTRPFSLMLGLYLVRASVYKNVYQSPASRPPQTGYNYLKYAQTQLQTRILEQGGSYHGWRHGDQTKHNMQNHNIVYSITADATVFVMDFVTFGPCDVICFTDDVTGSTKPYAKQQHFFILQTLL